MFKKIALALITLSASAGFVSNASALPVDCDDGLGLPCLADRGDVLADGIVVPNSGQDTETVVEAALEIATGVFTDLTLYGKSDSNPSLFTFSNFSSGSSLTGSKGGSWSVKDGTLISYITVKASNSFILYSFAPSSQGTYSTLGILTNGGEQPDVSHISFWTSNKRVEVPEPATMSLLFSSMAGLGFLKRRRASVEG